MDIAYMREFLTLVKCANFTRAAEELYISQPTLTRHVNSLEHELGAALLVRKGHAFELTQAGNIAVNAFENMLDEYGSFVEDIEQVAQSAASDLTVGMLYYGVSAYYGYPLLQEFALRHPHVHVSTICSQSGQIYRNIRRGLVDVALTITEMDVDDELERALVDRIPLYAFMQTDHPLAMREKLSLEELAEQTIVINRYSRGARNNVEALFAKHGIELNHIEYAEHIDDVLMRMERTGGLFIGSMLMTAIPQQHHAFVPIDADDFGLDIALVWRAENDSEMISNLVETSKHIRKPTMHL